MHLLDCPRCGDRSYEKLNSHDHCVSCNYSTEFDIKLNMPIPQWATDVVDDPKDGIAKLIAEIEADVAKKDTQDGAQETGSSLRTLDVA
jgi:ribosomal protein L37E